MGEEASRLAEVVVASAERVMENVADRMVCENYLSQNSSEEEREQRIKEYLSLHCEMEKCLYLTGETMLKCTEGDHGEIFQPTDHNVYMNGDIAIAATDCKVGEHFKSFGVCFAQTNKMKEVVMCNPKIAHGKWLESCSKMKVGDEDSVNENSYLICTRAEGAKIYPVLGVGYSDEGQEIEEELGIEDQIELLMEQIGGEKITTYEEMVNLPTVEILARMIYQEDRCFDQGRQNAIVFSVVNRLWVGGCNLTDKLGEKKSNNLYGIVTAGSQYNSVFMDEKLRDKINNSYWPPVDQNAPQSEKEGWENAKRLAAITYLAVEMYGEGEETERGRCVVSQNDDVRENIIDFMEAQVDSQGNEIINVIGDYRSFRAGNNEVDAEKYRLEGKIAFEDENGKTVGNVFQEK